MNAGPVPLARGTDVYDKIRSALDAVTFRKADHIMNKSPSGAGLAVRGLDSRRFFSLTFLSGLALALAACGNSHEARAAAAPSVTAAGPATSLAAIQAKLAGEQAKIAAAVV